MFCIRDRRPECKAARSARTGIEVVSKANPSAEYARLHIMSHKPTGTMVEIYN